MNPAIRTTIRKGVTVASILALLACTAASCGPDQSEIGRPRCAFADPEMMTSLGICEIAAEYYVAKHEWPLSLAQLEEQWGRMLDEAKKEMSPEEAKEGAGFFERFTLLELREKGDGLVLHFRFKIDKKAVKQTVLLRPGSTADEIVQAATDGS